jgi:UDP-glucose 4-epimerase
MILVTGGLGFLGCSIAYYLAKQGAKVLLTRYKTSRIPVFLEALLGTSVWITPCDILDFSNLWFVLETHPIESIIHAAGTPGQKGYLYQALTTNVLGTMNVLEASRIKKIGRVTFTSSQSVYSRGEKYHEESEDLPLKSLHTISLTKKVGDLICNHYAREYEMEIIITRPCQLYGPLYSSERNPLQRMVENAVAGKTTDLSEVAPNDGNNIMYVKDCARALVLIHLKEKLQFRIYNIADEYFTYREMATAVRKVIPTAEIHLGLERADVPGRMFLNLDRLKNEFGFTPEYDLESGIRDWMDWLRDGQFSDTDRKQD